MIIIPVLTSKTKTIQATATVTAMVSSAGLIKVTTAAAHGFETGDIVQIAGTVGIVEANKQWVLTVLDSTHFTLNNSIFGNTYVSGGTVAHIGYSTPCTTFNEFFFAAVPSDLTGKVLIQSAPQGAKLRWSFDDAQLGDSNFLTVMPGPSGCVAGGVSPRADWIWSFFYCDFPDLLIGMFNSLRFRILWAHGTPGSTYVLSAWFETT